MPQQLLNRAEVRPGEQGTNFERPTLNLELRTRLPAGCRFLSPAVWMLRTKLAPFAPVQRWMFDVQRSMFAFVL